MIIENAKAHCILHISDSPLGCMGYDYTDIYIHKDIVNPVSKYMILKGVLSEMEGGS